jgi:hypothetical protein
MCAPWCSCTSFLDTAENKISTSSSSTAALRLDWKFSSYRWIYVFNESKEIWFRLLRMLSGPAT